MTTTLNIPETTDQFAEMLHRVQAGEEILLTKDGVATLAVSAEQRARILPIQTTLQPRIPGQDKGKVFIASDFNAPLPEHILNDFLSSSLPTL
jgi:antitoxin (DNA-binding transcriptional repressor) of toxin-antitoxin stability system